MQKSEDVVTHMQQNFNLKILFPNRFNLEQFRNFKPDIPFSTIVIDYLNKLSVSILKDKESRQYPDLITFAFFCRKANLNNIRKNYNFKSKLKLGRGIIFHIAPSNVPINFAYSLVAGLLSGNYNIVKLSSKYFYQIDLIVKHLKKLKEDNNFTSVSERICLVRYDNNCGATDYFSSFCNVRIIWGGDNTINNIRKSLIPPRSFDVTFADRYSIAVIDARILLEENNIKEIIEGFYNDTYLFDQNACSAPMLLVWKGNQENILKAKTYFWNELQRFIDLKYEFVSVMAVDKLTSFYLQSVDMKLMKEQSKNNKLVRVKLDKVPLNIENYRCTRGYFSEIDVFSLDEIAHIVNEKYQTMAYYGFNKEELNTFVLKNNLLGIDRIVPIGKTTDFSFIWDGYDLIEVLSRECSII